MKARVTSEQRLRMSLRRLGRARRTVARLRLPASERERFDSAAEQVAEAITAQLVRLGGGR